ncbi:uncharacterized protein LOC142920182 [Petromyzon marinus]|uniref:uncharacterized protein LOC142920182 n=1 Tax=Petromyzon marinus TaxID=7757 RepID=UPI003F71B9C4
MAMRQLVSRLGLLFLFLLLHLVTWCSSHASASPLNVRVESRDLLTQLRWEPADVNPATSSVTYRVESKLYGRAHWRTICAATTETRCDVSSALRHPGDRYQLRVRATVSSSSPVASPISLPWVVVEVLPLKTRGGGAPSLDHEKLQMSDGVNVVCSDLDSSLLAGGRHDDNYDGDGGGGGDGGGDVGGDGEQGEYMPTPPKKAHESGIDPRHILVHHSAPNRA